MALYTTKQEIESGAVSFSGDTFSGIVVTPENYITHGGALRISDTADVTIDGSTFYNNTIDADTAARYGGAIGFQSSGTLTITKTIFDGNKSIQKVGKGGAGALYATNGTVNISGSTFINNETRNGGAIYNNGSNITITDSYFGNNTASNVGDSIRNAKGTLTLSGVTFADASIDTIYNESTIYVTGKIVLTSDDVRITQAAADDAIILVGESFFTGANADAEILKAIDGTRKIGHIKGGTVYATDGYTMITDSNGDGDIYLYKGEIDQTVTGVSILSSEGKNCIAAANGTVYNGTAYSDYASAVGAKKTIVVTEFVRDSQTTQWELNSSVKHIFTRDTVFSNNNGQYKGGAFYSVNGDVEVYGSTFSNNILDTSSTSYVGGAISASGSLKIYNAVFTGNTARNGGAIYSSASTILVDGCTFTKNRATVNGVLHVAAGNCTIKDSYLGDTVGGNALYLTGATVNISGSTFASKSDGIYINNVAGVVNFSGKNIINAAITNGSKKDGVLSNIGTINVENAELVFDNSDAIKIAGFTFTENNKDSKITLNGKALVTFTDQDLSRATIIVDASLYTDKAVIVAAGVTGIDRYIITNEGETDLALSVNNLNKLVLQERAHENISVSGDKSGSNTFAGNGNDASLTVTISEVTANKVFAGSESGRDGKIKTTMTGGEIASTLYGGGKVSAESTDLSVSGGTVGASVYGGLLVESDDITLDSSKLTVTDSADLNSFVVGGSRVNGGKNHQIGSVELNISGGVFDRGASAYTWGAGYVKGGELSVDNVTVNLSSNIDGDIYGGAHNRDNGSSNVANSIINVDGGDFKRIYGGGWAQGEGSSSVGNVLINIEAGSVFAVYAGGANGLNSTSTIENAVINVSDRADIENIYLTGRHNMSHVSGDVTLNVSGGDVDVISGITPWGADMVAGTTKAVITTSLEDLIVDGVDVFAIGNKAEVNMREEIDSSDFTTLQFIIEDAENFSDSWTALTTDAEIDLANITVNFADANGSLIESGFDAIVSDDKKSILVSRA